MPDNQMKNEVMSLIETLSESEFLAARRFIEFLIAQREKFLKEPSRKKAAAKKLYGICAHIPGGSKEFLKEKYEDLKNELCY
ncbi:MAG: hypothetical protein ABRQ37_14900 [Candidatus Eremiobacterota bacterium]